eukprot:jgi/Ulvmu1/5247/UM022_0040.1
MALDLQILRTAKAALDEGLLNAADYDSVKASFIKAQSVKAGVEAGFISESDYAEARSAFFSGLGMSVGGSLPAPAPRQSAPAHAPTSSRSNDAAHNASKLAPVQAVSAPAIPASAQAPSSTAAAAPTTRAAEGTAAAPAATATKSEPIQATRPPQSNAIPPLSLPEAQNQPDGASTPTTGGSRSASLLPTPTGLSDRGGKVAADKKSMAGIKVHPDSVNVLWEVNIKKTYRWVIFYIGTTGKEVEIEKVGAPASTWDEFVMEIPDNQCRYGVFDYEYTNSDGTTFGKLCFVSWAPETAPVRAKMQHASTKDLFRSMLEGIAVDITATEKPDLAEAVLREKVKTTVAKK